MSRTTTASEERGLTGRDWAFLVTVYVMTFTAAFNENIMNVVLLEVANAFSVTADVTQWLVTGYMIVASIMTALTGFLSRRFTTRQLFFAAVVAIVAGEALCFVAPVFPMLLVFRLVQAVGSGIIFPLMMNVVMNVAPRKNMGVFLAIGTACITLGPAFGPVISGLADTLFGWRCVFVLPCVLALAMGILGAFSVRNLGEAEKVRADALSVVLLCLGLFLFVYAVGSITSATVMAVVLLVVSVAILAVFCRRQFTLEVPLLDLSCMKVSQFWPAAILTMISMMMSFSLSVLLPLYFEGVFGTTSLVAGLVILPAIVVNAVTSLVGGKILDARGTWPLLAAGYVLIAGGQIACALVSPSLAIGFGAVIACSVVVYAGVGFVMSPSQTAGLAGLDKRQEPAGAAILNMLIMIAASIGSSLFIGIMTSGAASAQAAGAAAEAAQASGFSGAIWVAVVIALVGLVLSVIYSRKHPLKNM